METSVTKRPIPVRWNDHGEASMKDCVCSSLASLRRRTMGFVTDHAWHRDETESYSA